MSQENTIKLCSKKKKQANGIDVKTTIKISGTLHKYFSSNKIVTPPSDDDPKTNQNENQRKATNHTEKASVFKVQIKEGTPLTSGKVWPCFMKSKPSKENIVNKKEDEARMRARAMFLESGTPEVLLKKKIQIEEDDEALDRPVPFPSISHVPQITADNCVNESTLPLPPMRPPASPLICPNWKTMSINESNEPEIKVFKRIGNAKTILDQLKEENSKTDVKALYKTLKMYKSESESNLWTDIYKPNKSLDLLGNSEQIKKLRIWLDDLKKKKNTEAADSSGDEFVDESDDEAKNFSQNVAVIKGPCGSGKTSAVFAVANQLDCKVLEINTSCNRSGKRILAEFLESTQSHQVERVNMIEALVNGKPTKSRKRKRSKAAEEKKLEKTSLILVEEADLVFENIDDGFTQAMFSLASSSKRPLILTTNHNRNPHLDRFKNSDSLELCFSRPRYDKLALWLRLVGLVEGIAITRAQAIRLVQWARGDVRRCLLQMQIMLLSNNSEVTEPVSAANLWWNWPLSHELEYKLPTLVKSNNETETVENVSKHEQLKRLLSVAASTSCLSCLDILTSHSSLGGETPCPVSWMAQSADSVMLTEHCENSNAKCPQELAEWLLCKMASENTRSESYREAKWLSVLRQGEQLYLSGVPQSQLSARDSLACDYLPALRTFGRCDQVRLPVYTRRTSRIFNYLQGLGIHASKSFNDFMCDAFS